MFICTKCGLCCRNIGGISELTDFHTGDGICVYLSDENLCTIYATRPDICNVDKMYELSYKTIMTKSEYEAINVEGCRVLQAISPKPANPFQPVDQKQVFSDLAESRRQVAAGQGLDMEDALNMMGKQHGFI